MKQDNSELLESIVEKYNEYYLKHAIAYYPSDAILNGAKKTAYAEVISIMTGLSPKEVYRNYCRWTHEEIALKRKNHHDECKKKEIARWNH